jgi:hypothetical protein
VPSTTMVRLGRRKGPGGNNPNGVPVLAQPIAVASSRRAWRYAHGAVSGTHFIL